MEIFSLHWEYYVLNLINGKESNWKRESSAPGLEFDIKDWKEERKLKVGWMVLNDT